MENPANPLIILTGMPGVGKTWWGKKITQEYNMAFTDLDTYIEQEEKTTISALFSHYGEEAFRTKEHEYLKKAIAKSIPPTLIATGGGTPAFKDNMRHMKESGTVIYLRAEIPYLVNNIKRDVNTRPLLTNQSHIKSYLSKLLSYRKNFYEQSHYILDVENISLVTFGEIITKCINRH